LAGKVFESTGLFGEDFLKTETTFVIQLFKTARQDNDVSAFSAGVIETGGVVNVVLLVRFRVVAVVLTVEVV